MHILIEVACISRRVSVWTDNVVCLHEAEDFLRFLAEEWGVPLEGDWRNSSSGLEFGVFISVPTSKPLNWVCKRLEIISEHFKRLNPTHRGTLVIDGTC